MAFNIKLYATDIKITGGETPDKITFETEATDVITFDMDSKGLYPEMALDGATKYGGKLFSGDVELSFTLKTMPFSFPDTLISIWDYFNLPFFRKTYHYLDAGDYPIFIDANNDDLLYRIAITGVKVDTKEENGTKTIDISFKLGE